MITSAPRATALALTLAVLAASAHAAGARAVDVPAPGLVASQAADDYGLPVAQPSEVVHTFEAPLTRWSAGHRGVDLAVDVGAPVLAPAGGVVTFAGPVAGRSVLTILHPDGRRSSLEPVTADVTTGASVMRGERVGTVQADVATHCAPTVCVHWGVRDGETYLDPMSLILGIGPIVLLPLTG